MYRLLFLDSLFCSIVLSFFCSAAAAAAAAKSLQSCPTLCEPTRLPHPWDSPGKNTGVGCHFLLQWMKVKSESEVAQSCLTLFDPMDCASEKAMAPHSSTLAWKIPWMEEPGRLQSMGSLSVFTFTFHLHALEKEMATHSSVLAWRIPGMGETGRLLSVGSHRVGHD